METQNFVYNDGGRKESGFKGRTSDCVVRAIAIAMQKPYDEVYDAITWYSKAEVTRTKKRSSPRSGVHRKTYEKYIKSFGWVFVPTVGIGTGCKIHLKKEELPSGRLIVLLSRHLVAVIDGVVHDTYDCTRGGTRCVYGYYKKP